MLGSNAVRSLENYWFGLVSSLARIWFRSGWSILYIGHYLYMLFGPHVRSEGIQMVLLPNVAVVAGLKVVRCLWYELLCGSERPACRVVKRNSEIVLVLLVSVVVVGVGILCNCCW